MPAVAGNETAIFILTFSLNSGAPADTYDVNVIATVLDNAAAGYDSAEAIPMIIGSNLSISEPADPAAFPVLLDPNATSPIGSVVQGTVTFKIDSDSDGMEDSWEEAYFDGIEATDGTDDSDQDGYSDLQEFLNGTDPGEPDAPGGEGYNPATDDLSISGSVSSDNDTVFVSLIIKGEIVDVIEVQTATEDDFRFDFRFELPSDPKADEYTLTAVDNEAYGEITVPGAFLPIVVPDIDLNAQDLIHLAFDDNIEYEKTESTDGSDFIFAITAEDGAESVTQFPNGLILTLPFNIGAVTPGDFESGDVTIYHADTRAELIAGDGTAVLPEDILSVDYIGDDLTGWVAFGVYSLSVFGIGVKADNNGGGGSVGDGGGSGGGGSGGGGGCYISTIARIPGMALPAAILVLTGFGLVFSRAIRFRDNR